MVYVAQATFSRGELSPELRSRVDLEFFRAGLAECKNFITLKRGGIRRRGGTKYIASVKTHADGARLVPFQFSTVQAYILEFGDRYFRVYTSAGRVGTVEVTTPYSRAEVEELHFVQSADVLFVVHPDYAPRKIERASNTSWSISTLEIESGPFLPVNTTSTTLTPSDYGSLTPKMTSNTAPSGTAASDTSSSNAYLVFDKRSATDHETAQTSGWISYTPATPKIANRYSIRISTLVNQHLNAPTSWSIEGYDGSSWVTLDAKESETGWSDGEIRYYSFFNETAYEAYRFSYRAVNGGAQLRIAELDFNSVGETLTLTASNTTGINDGNGFQTTDVGRLIQLRFGDARPREYRITARSSATVVTVENENSHSIPELRATQNWSLGSFSDESGWPGAIGFFKERLCFANTAAQPTTVWMSQSGDFSNFAISTPLVSSDAVSLDILSDQVNAVKWLAEDAELVVGTSASVRRIGKANSGDPFGPDNVQQSRATTFGSNAVQPVNIGSTVLYWGRFGTDLRELVYNFDVNGYVSQSLSELSNHLLADGITWASYQQYPVSVIWQTTSLGALRGFTYEREQQVYGFHQHDLSGEIESVASIATDTYDEVWLAVKRTINGSTVRYIEVLQKPFDGDAQEDAWHVDSGLRYEGSAANTVSGLSHLEGETVAIHADGAYYGTATVTSGEVSLLDGETAEKILVGLPFTSRAKLLRPPVNAQDGASMGRKMRVDKVFIDVLETGSLKAGSDRGSTTSGKQLDQLIRIRDSDGVDLPVPLRTEVIQGEIDMRWDEDGQLVLECDDTQPCTILSVNYSLDGEP